MKPTFLFLSLAAVAALLTGCGGGEKKSDATAAVPAPAASGARVVKLTGDDTMKYNITEITATPGEALRIEMKNVGRMPKASMSHNFVLVKPMSDADIGKLAMDAATKAPTYMPVDKSAILAHTKLLGPNETDAVEFKAPTEPGEYPYFCTFPGHFALMRGKLIVK
jgi:azurin